MGFLAPEMDGLYIPKSGIVYMRWWGI